MPSSSSTIRKLAAIMFTDIAGFTALSSKDSLKASELLNIQREKLQPIVEEYNGKWLKEKTYQVSFYSSAESAIFNP